MDSFEYKKGSLFCEQVPVAEIAEQVGTPAYIYSAETLRRHYRAIADAFGELDTTVCFAVKSLHNVHVLKLLVGEGAGFDIVSGGELARVLAAGADPAKVVFSGVAKTDREINEAIEAGIAMFNVESEAEFENISRLAAAAKANVRAALRVNPDIYDPKTHAKTTTGKKETKFGVDIDRAEAFFDTYGRDEYVTLDGIDMHLGSPIYSAEPFVRGIAKAIKLIDSLKAKGIEIRMLDLGGGLAADYEQGASPIAGDYASEIVPLLKGRGLEIIIEPGRQISCNSGILLTTVEYIKQGGSKQFAIVDAAMTDLIRPALYDAMHFIYPAALAEGATPPQRKMDFAPADAVTYDIVGGVCETCDYLGKDRSLPALARGDLLAVFSAGAYGAVMSSQYNSHPRAPEVLVEGDSFRVIRRRETYDDLFAEELDV